MSNEMIGDGPHRSSPLRLPVPVVRVTFCFISGNHKSVKCKSKYRENPERFIGRIKGLIISARRNKDFLCMTDIDGIEETHSEIDPGYVEEIRFTVLEEEEE